MTSSVFAVLFGLNFVLFPCKGQVSPPSSGDTFVVLHGEDVTITWKLDVGVPSIDFRSWTFLPKGTFAHIAADGEVVNTTQYSPGPFTITKPSTLILKNVNIQYNGTYAFVVVSGVKHTSSPVHVFVAVKPTETINCRSFVTVDEGCKDFTVDEGKNFTCVCRGENGNPPASVTWYKDGIQIGTTEKEEQTLTRSNVTETDSGTYKCVAQSHTLTLTEEKSVVVKVYTRPNVTGITFAPNPVEVGKAVTITCDESEGVPEPSYTISHNGKLISSEKTFTISEVKQSDERPYTCVAQNRLGRDSTTANLIVVASKKLNSDSSGTVVVWHIVISLVSGIIIGILVCYIVWCSCRRWLKNRRPQSNPEAQTTEPDTTYQELNLSKMNTEENYQSLRVNAASYDVPTDDDSTYTELSKSRDEENKYQSLT